MVQLNYYYVYLLLKSNTRLTFLPHKPFTMKWDACPMTTTTYANTTSPQHHPYSTAQVCEMFSIQETTLKNLVQVLKLAPSFDAEEQQLRFGETDVERLKKAIQLHRQGKPLSEIVQLLGSETRTQTGLSAPASNTMAPFSATKENASPSGGTAARHPDSAEGLATVVEAISHSKDYILTEMSRLLDDRLSGLDEVVVELIRTKSENDALRHKISSLTKEVESAKAEVDCFKPVQFGFYKKVKTQ
jgi:DNA-binding transcriptional MerR regulator